MNCVVCGRDIIHRVHTPLSTMSCSQSKRRMHHSRRRLDLTLQDERDVLELYRAWTRCNGVEFRGNWNQVPRHCSLSDYTHRTCDFLERRRFCICKLTGHLYLSPHSDCQGVNCPFATETRYGETVCSITGRVVVPGLQTAHVLASNMNPVSRQDVERMNVDSAFSPSNRSKRVKQVAPFEVVAGRVQSYMLALANNLICDCVMLKRKEDAPLLEQLVCAFFFHTQQSIKSFRRVTAAFLTVLSTHDRNSFPQLPNIEVYLYNMRNWRNVIGCEHKTITQTQKKVLNWLRNFEWAGQWIIRPNLIRDSSDRYIETLHRFLEFESYSAATPTSLNQNMTPSSPSSVAPR